MSQANDPARTLQDLPKSWFPDITGILQDHGRCIIALVNSNVLQWRCQVVNSLVYVTVCSDVNNCEVSSSEHYFLM